MQIEFMSGIFVKSQERSVCQLASHLFNFRFGNCMNSVNKWVAAAAWIAAAADAGVTQHVIISVC